MTVEGTRSLPGEMSADKTPGLDPTLCLKAAQSILQFHAKEANQSRQSLLEDAKGINLEIVFNGLPDMNYNRASPYSLPLPHAIYEKDTEVCVFVDGGPKDNLKSAYKDALVPAHAQKVITELSLKRKYSDQDSRYSLRQKFDLFLASDSLKTRLPRLLGKPFVGSNKYPTLIPLSKSKKKLWPSAIARKKRCAVWFLRQKSKSSMRIGSTSLKANELVENCNAAVNGLVRKLPKGFKEILKISLKGPDMPALPVYQSLPAFPMSDNDPSEPTIEASSHCGDSESARGKKHKTYSSDAHVSSIISSILEESIWQIGVMESNGPDKKKPQKSYKRDFTRFSTGNGDIRKKKKKARI